MLQKRKRGKKVWYLITQRNSISLFPIASDPNSLQNVNISVISKSQCRNTYKAQNIKETMLCVGIVPGRRKPCKVRYSQCLNFRTLFLLSVARKITWFLFSWQEVTAAPAVCNGILQGILTFTDGCVLRADVGIYTKIFNYMPWIETTIQNN